MDIKYFVRTTGERSFDYSPLKYETLIDTEHNVVKHYLDSLKYIQDYNAVLMEDDLVLCKNFKTEIEKVITSNPDDIINFFTSPNRYFTSYYTDSFVYNQCTYFPKGSLKEIIPKFEEIYNQGIYRLYGPILNVILKDLGIIHYIYRPALVQHIDNNSLLSKNKNRQTIYFKDYLDELGINIKEAFLKENREKLILIKEREMKKFKEFS